MCDELMRLLQQRARRPAEGGAGGPAEGRKLVRASLTQRLGRGTADARRQILAQQTMDGRSGSAGTHTGVVAQGGGQIRGGKALDGRGGDMCQSVSRGAAAGPRAARAAGSTSGGGTTSAVVAKKLSHLQNIYSSPAGAHAAGGGAAPGVRASAPQLGIGGLLRGRPRSAVARIESSSDVSASQHQPAEGARVTVEPAAQKRSRLLSPARGRVGAQRAAPVQQSPPSAVLDPAGGNSRWDDAAEAGDGAVPVARRSIAELIARFRQAPNPKAEAETEVEAQVGDDAALHAPACQLEGESAAEAAMRRAEDSRGEPSLPHLDGSPRLRPGASAVGRQGRRGGAGRSASRSTGAERGERGAAAAPGERGRAAREVEWGGGPEEAEASGWVWSGMGAGMQPRACRRRGPPRGTKRRTC